MVVACEEGFVWCWIFLEWSKNGGGTEDGRHPKHSKNRCRPTSSRRRVRAAAAPRLPLRPSPRLAFHRLPTSKQQGGRLARRQPIRPLEDLNKGRKRGGRPTDGGGIVCCLCAGTLTPLKVDGDASACSHPRGKRSMENTRRVP